MTEILAVAPQAGAVIHLHVAGYRPGKKPRSVERVGLCNINLHMTDQNTAPLAEALSWPDKTCGCWTPGWRWCRTCLGHAATLAGIVDHVLYLIVRATTPCSCDGRRWVEDEGWSPEFAEQVFDERVPGKGLIPCGTCNHGGWGVDEYEVDEP